MITNMERVRSILDSVGIKPSVQRIAVLKYLMEHKTHPTVDEIYEALNPTIPTLSRTTVYNTLKLLTQHNAILMLTIDENSTRYDADTSDHSHFICARCGKVFDFETPQMENLRLANNFLVTTKHLYVKGVCCKCNQAS